MINIAAALLLLTCQILTSFTCEIFEKISNKTWFDESAGPAGESIVFTKSETGQKKVILQSHGFGVPVLFTEVYNIEIQHDTIYLTNSLKTNDAPKNFFIYNDQQGLLNKGKQLRVMFHEPIIYVWSEKRKIIDKKVNLNKVTSISFEKNEVIINDNTFKILREE